MDALNNSDGKIVIAADAVSQAQEKRPDSPLSKLEALNMAVVVEPTTEEEEVQVQAPIQRPPSPSNMLTALGATELVGEQTQTQTQVQNDAAPIIRTADLVIPVDEPEDDVPPTPMEGDQAMARLAALAGVDGLSF